MVRLSKDEVIEDVMYVTFSVASSKVLFAEKRGTEPGAKKLSVWIWIRKKKSCLF